MQKSGFNYDILFAGRPDMLLGAPITFRKDDGSPTKLYDVMTNNEVLYTSWGGVNSRGQSYRRYSDHHYIFNTNTARVFADNMFPFPTRGWPELAKLRNNIDSHTGWIQEFLRNNGIKSSQDELVWATKDEIVMRRVGEGRHWKQRWVPRMEVLNLPDHCFPQAKHDGERCIKRCNMWNPHVSSNDPQCYPVYHEHGRCPANQNEHMRVASDQ